MPDALPTTPADAVPMAAVRRVLVTKLRHHGDVLLTSPVFSTLKRLAPDATVDALVYADTAPMIAGHPAIAQVHTIDRGWKDDGLAAQWHGERALMRGLRAHRYDLLLHLTDHPRGLLLARALAPRYAVTRQRAASGDRAWLWQRYFTHFYKLPRNTQRHTVETNLDALRRIGVQPDAQDKPLSIYPGAAAEARADALLAAHGLAARGFIHAHPGSRWLFKCWPVAQTAALYTQLVADGHRIVVTGAPDVRERALVDAVLAASSIDTRGGIVDLTGTLSMPELAAVCGRARAFIGVDSAPMHIAAAQRIPTVALFGPSGDVEWGPWHVPHRVVASLHHPCRPCGQDGCGGGKVSECLTTLPVDRVHAALDELLAATA